LKPNGGDVLCGSVHESPAPEADAPTEKTENGFRQLLLENDFGGKLEEIVSKDVVEGNEHALDSLYHTCVLSGAQLVFDTM
jgi:hypothetical protein